MIKATVLNNNSQVIETQLYKGFDNVEQAFECAFNTIAKMDIKGFLKSNTKAILYLMNGNKVVIEK